MRWTKTNWTRLPPRCILVGLYSAGLPQKYIGLWYGVTRQAVSYALKHGRREGWNSPVNDELQAPSNELRMPSEKPYTMRPYHFGDSVDYFWVQNNHRPKALPPQSVLDTWRRLGWSPEKIAGACKHFSEATGVLTDSCRK